MWPFYTGFTLMALASTVITTSSFHDFPRGQKLNICLNECVYYLLIVYHRLHLTKVTLWAPAGKGLTSWLSFMMSNCEFVTFPLVSWVRCGTWLYRFLIFALFLTFFLNFEYPLPRSFFCVLTLRIIPQGSVQLQK